MRCKKHHTDLSSSIGVCACCLRERLLSLIAAQQHFDGKHHDSEKNPAVFRSLSPNFNSRKSDRSDGAAVRSDEAHRKDAPRHHHSLSEQLFYRTPEIRPATGGHNTGVSSKKKKPSFIRLVSFQNVFRSRNRKPVDSSSCGGNTATSSSSWFSISSIVSGGRHRRKKTVCIDESTITASDGPVRRQHCGDRGMSPVRNPDAAGEADELRNATSGYESIESWKNTPRRTPVVRRGGSGGHVRNISGLTFCLSPLVRASPNLQWNDVVLPEIGGPVKPHLSNTKSFCANRSRKLVDFGRVNPNR